jgi:hypothetical protein
MLKLLAVLKKNAKNMLRAKVSSLIILLGPLIIMLLAGLAFSTTKLEGVKIGVVTHEKTQCIQN